MLFCLDVGNSQTFGGVYDGEQLLFTFRRTSNARASSDESGIFFRTVLRENDVDPAAVNRVAICSVVPDAVHSLRNCFLKYFRVEPFLLRPGVKTGLKIRYRNPLEVGADKIANAMGAVGRYPRQDLIIVDFGTATTLCAVSANTWAALSRRGCRLPCRPWRRERRSCPRWRSASPHPCWAARQWRAFSLACTTGRWPRSGRSLAR